jgi:hypothetical protein
MTLGKSAEFAPPAWVSGLEADQAEDILENDVPEEVLEVDEGELVGEDGGDVGEEDAEHVAHVPIVFHVPEEQEDEEEVEQAREKTWEDDEDHSQFIVYLTRKLNEIPRHSGQTTVGCEKAIAYLKRLDREISKAIQGDENGVIDEEEAEKLRDMIFDYIQQLEGAYESLMEGKKGKKKAGLRIGKTVFARINDGLDIQYFISVANDEGENLLAVELAEPTDEQVTAFIEGEKLEKSASAKITLVEDPFLHQITKMIITSHVTNGKDLETVYAALDEKYKFTDREHLSIQGLLELKGLFLNKDLGRIGEDNVRPFDGKGIEHSTKYYA